MNEVVPSHQVDPHGEPRTPHLGIDPTRGESDAVSPTTSSGPSRCGAAGDPQ
jgi:hypothetical protein